MGRLRKRFNENARQKSVVGEKKKKNDVTIKENSILPLEEDSYKSTRDESNALVLTSKKNNQKMKPLNLNKKVKKLTKKQKKKLENIVEQKKKKEKRADILKSLSACQVTQEELSLYKSTSKLGQVINTKRKVAETSEISETSEIGELSSTAKRKRKTRKKIAGKLVHENEVSTLQIEESDDEEISSESENESKQSNEDECIENVFAEGNESSEEHEESIVCAATKNQVGFIENDKDAKINHNINEDVVEDASITHSKGDTVAATAQTERKNVTPVYVHVKRTKEIQTARLLLPILPEEQAVMEAIQENDVVVICGSTGSGKTTQVPQFLYEAGYGTSSLRNGVIGITEPRRVAAISMSKRVAKEMSMPNSKISYQIRYEGNTTDETVIKFMTDGVLLKEMEADFLLTKYSALIIDEAHERSVYTDILIGLLSRVVPLRKKNNNPLKLIIMSATLRVEDFTKNEQLFKISPPVLKIDARQYPVTIHFNRRTAEDYVTEAFKKVCKINRTLKMDGGILVFLTGQNEVQALCRKLSRTFPKKSKIKVKEPITRNKKVARTGDGEKKNLLPKINLDNYSTGLEDKEDDTYDDIEDDQDFMYNDSTNSDDDYIESDNDADVSAYSSTVDDSSPLHVLPLYSLLSSERQAQVFADAPPGCRLCVIATNVAETSLTIPGIKYIVDCGKVKKKVYDKVTGVSTFRITWTSKASANQRSGRAGRVAPGHCYRLYSSAVFQNDFEEFSEPEICRRPVDDLLLQMKSMCIDKVVNFPFPSTPDVTALQAAEKLLLDLGALKIQKTKQGQELAIITSLGKSLSKIPVSPRFSKMIWLASKQNNCYPYIIAIVAALTVKEIFTDDIELLNVPDIEADNLKQKRVSITIARRKWAGEGPASLLGDLMVILRAVGACEYSGCSEKFCESNGLRYKAMVEIRKLRRLLTNAVSFMNDDTGAFVDPKMEPPTERQALQIRQIVLSGLSDHVARKVPPDEAKSLKIKNGYRCCSTDDLVFIHPTSSLFSKLPEYVVYHEIMETSKLYMKTLLCVQEDWLPKFAPHMCSFGKPCEKPEPIYSEEEDCINCYMACTFGPHVWQLPVQLLKYPDNLEKYKWFARYLLEGEILKELQEFATGLLTPASVMVKSWAHLQQKTESILNCLIEEKIDSKEKLIKIWKKKPQYLLKQYLQWVPEVKHGIVRIKWPPSG